MHYTFPPEAPKRAHLLGLIARLNVGTQLENFHQPQVFAVGGLEAIGYSENSKYILLVSSRGRGLLDVDSGRICARDPDDSLGWLDTTRLECFGIGPAQDQVFRISGFYGAGLPCTSGKGESLDCISPNWPRVMLIYQSNSQSWYIKPETCTMIWEDYELRAYGFSFDSQSFVVASSSELLLFRRKVT